MMTKKETTLIRGFAFLYHIVRHILRMKLP
jgi:hypothetical protein